MLSQRSIAFDYWFNIGLAVAVIIVASLFSDGPGLDPVVYFIATAFLIHAHGNRTRDTLLLLHEERLK